MSKNAGEKCGKLCISSILSPKRDITPTKIDIHSKSCAKFQLNMSKRVREKCRKVYLQYCKFQKRHNSKIDAN